MQERRKAGDAPEYGFTLIEWYRHHRARYSRRDRDLSLTGVTGQSKQAACNSDAKTVETAVSAYFAETGNQPADFAGAYRDRRARSVPSYGTERNGCQQRLRRYARCQ